MVNVSLFRGAKSSVVANRTVMRSSDHEVCLVAAIEGGEDVLILA